ncbi:adenylosuccinate synthase [Christensenellaceae bacterium OttesenSCG-928-M15]|nr:adenylosuccinate synthase [Christensenellaceae bacterium OttesenSCG-928-M15]
MSTCAIVGVNWGDEGKGRMVDLLAEQYDVVVRYQGGSNAGHTVINQFGKFALNLLPSGIFREEVVNVLGNGTVIDLEHLCGEIDKLKQAGIEVTPERLKISDRAIIVFPFHKDQDGLEEARLKDAKYGSTKRGIAPVYSDKYQKKGIQMGDLLFDDVLEKHLKTVVEWKNLTLTGVYKAEPRSYEEMLAWVKEYGERLKPYITDVGVLLHEANKAGKSILFEAQLGALRDIELGIYPFTSSSSPLAAYAPLGAGVPGVRVDEVVGVVKAYSSCVGEGPFVAEWFGEEAEKLREAGGEYGAATGRPRRVGPFDLIATRYGTRLQGCTKIALTKMDVLSYMEQIPVCTGYKIDGKVVDNFPFTPMLDGAEPVIEYLPGWKVDISGVRDFKELPKAAQDYVLYIEKMLECPVTYVSVGPDRDALMYR